MESLVILTTPNKDSHTCFDVIIGKLDVENIQEAEHTDHFELTILGRYIIVVNKINGGVKENIERLIAPYLDRIEKKLKGIQ